MWQCAARSAKMVRLRSIIVLVVLLVNLVSCENKQSACIVKEGVKICASAEYTELLQPLDAAIVLRGNANEQSSADNSDSAIAAGETNVQATHVISNASTANTRIYESSVVAKTVSVNSSKTPTNAVSGTVVSSDEHADASASNFTEINASRPADSGIAAQRSTRVEDSSRVVDEPNTKKQDSSAVDVNARVQEGSAEVAEENVSKQENAAASAIPNANKPESLVLEGNSSAQKDFSKDVKETAKKNDSSIAAANENSTKQGNSTVSDEANTNIDNRSAVAAEGNTLQEIPARNGETSSSTLSNTTVGIQIQEQGIAKNQTSESATGELNPPEVAPTERLEIANSISGTGVQTGDRALSQSEDPTSSPELVALAEGIVIAGAILQVATAKAPPPADMSPAQEVALAEGLEMADAVLQAVREDEPTVNAIWRATLEAESSWKQDGGPANQATLDKGLISFLVCVMVVLAITGSISGWVLYTRLTRTPEEDQAQNMYVLIDASDPQPTFVDCPLDLNDSEEISYTFPRVINDSPS